jgi:hypothetical protein
MLIFAPTVIFLGIAAIFGFFAWRAYRRRAFAPMIARLLCFAVAIFGAEEMFRLALKFMTAAAS